MSTAEKAKAKIKAKIAGLSLKMLCEVYEGLNSSKEDTAPLIRGFVMDELEKRNETAFNEWIESEDIEKIDLPSKFFIA